MPCLRTWLLVMNQISEGDWLQAMNENLSPELDPAVDLAVTFWPCADETAARARSKNAFLHYCSLAYFVSLLNQ